MHKTLLTGYTLADITSTGEVAQDSRYRDQQRNWEVITQVVGLRARIYNLSKPAILNMSVDSLNFGQAYTGMQLVWRFSFAVDNPLVFFNGINDTGLLDLDFENVPLTTNLAETVKFVVPVFMTDKLHRNIYFKINK